MSDTIRSAYNPDVLTCLANLSNDEVFTPPQVVNRMLDMLPERLFRDPATTFLDPACKSGVFLREIAKRLIQGLENEIPDLQERVDHIFKNQLFGIAITEMTSILSRRSVYYSKYPNSKHSVVEFDNAEGNIKFKKTLHTWLEGKCTFCNASQTEYDRDVSLESHAYEFIHVVDFEEAKNMKFDVIISNPPYQLSDGGNNASAIPIYNKFVEQAKKLNPRYLTMIVPSRWFSGGRGLNDFRNDMLSDKRIRVINDYFDSNECFPGIDLSGGVCIFLWDRDNEGDCRVSSSINGETTVMNRPLREDGQQVFLRFNEAISIVRKVKEKGEGSFAELVSTQRPYGLRTYVQGTEKTETNDVRLYSNRNVRKEEGYISLDQIPLNTESISKWKVFISRVYGERGSFPYLVLGKPFIGEPKSCCTETFLLIGPFTSEQECLNVISYINTRFFRFLALQHKSTQDAPRRVYSLIPTQDFSKPWTDEELYAKYEINKEEIDFIERMIRVVEVSGSESTGRE